MNIGFAQMTYTLSEEDPLGQGNSVQVCIILMGELDDDVEVVLTAVSGSATGDTLMLLQYFCILCECLQHCRLKIAEINPRLLLYLLPYRGYIISKYINLWEWIIVGVVKISKYSIDVEPMNISELFLQQ